MLDGRWAMAVRRAAGDGDGEGARKVFVCLARALLASRSRGRFGFGTWWSGSTICLFTVHCGRVPWMKYLDVATAALEVRFDNCHGRAGRSKRALGKAHLSESCCGLLHALRVPTKRRKPHRFLLAPWVPWCGAVRGAVLYS